MAAARLQLVLSDNGWENTVVVDGLCVVLLFVCVQDK